MARHTKAFDYPVTQTRLDITRPLITQSHRHGWAYTKAFDYPVTQTLLDIPRPLITQSWGTGGKPKCSVPRVGLERTNRRLTAQRAIPLSQHGSPNRKRLHSFRQTILENNLWQFNQAKPIAKISQSYPCSWSHSRLEKQRMAKCIVTVRNIKWYSDLLQGTTKRELYIYLF